MYNIIVARISVYDKSISDFLLVVVINAELCKFLVKEKHLKYIFVSDKKENSISILLR